MSFSPPLRFSSASSGGKKQEELINAYEAEEEKIINVLSRKLEQLREEKIELENILEAESESHVNKLSRELSALRLAQHTQHNQQNGNAEAGTRSGFSTLTNSNDPTMPTAENMLEAMRKENEQLRTRLVDAESDYIRVNRLNEIYREELIQHRRRLGLPVDNLIGLASQDPFSQPTHRRSVSNSPAMSVFAPSRPSQGVPIPAQPTSRIHRPVNVPSESGTPLSHSPLSSDSPFIQSPSTSGLTASLLSIDTHATTPPSSASANSNAALFMGLGIPSMGLTYPSVPPPSLASSVGSPTIAYHVPHREPPMSPGESLSRRSSSARRAGFDQRRVAESGSFRSTPRGRRESIERGARIAETGTLVPRSRAGSQSLAPTTEASDAAENADNNDFFAGELDLLEQPQKKL